MTDETPRTIERDDGKLDAVQLASVLQMHRDGRPVYVTYVGAAQVLPALGLPLTLGQVRFELTVATSTIGGRAVAPLAAFVERAQDFLNNRLLEPNRRKAAAQKARAAKRQVPVAAA
jgi:hypothetical protein